MLTIQSGNEDVKLLHIIIIERFRGKTVVTFLIGNACLTWTLVRSYRLFEVDAVGSGQFGKNGMRQLFMSFSCYFTLSTRLEFTVGILPFQQSR